MSKRLAGLLVVSLFVLVGQALLGPGARPVSAQGNSDSVMVIHESKHDHHVMSPDDPLVTNQDQATANHEMVLRLTHAPGIARQMRDPALQTSTGPTVATASGVNFAGVGANGWAPPDTNGAAGLTQYVQWVNVEFAAYDKSDGSLVYGPAEGNSIWSGFGGQCQNNNSGDIIAQYDKQANRWVMMQPAFTSPYTICVAVSTSSTWTSSGIGWYRYAFAVPPITSKNKNTADFPDYPKLSVWPDGYYLSYNRFANGNTWAGPQACVMDRAKMLAGQTATMQCAASPGTSIESMLPSDLDGDVSTVSGDTLAPPTGSPAYYLGIYGGSNSELALFEFHVDWTTPSNSTFTGPAFVSVSSFNEACGGGTCIPQPNTSQDLDSLADRLMYRLAYRNFGDHESLVVSHSVDPGNGTSGIRWYELRETSPSTPPNSNWTRYQQGTYSPDSNYRWMPSIAMDKVGDIAVGYSESSSSVAPSIFYTGWLVGDPLGALESEAPILQGAYSQTSGLSRWGDYSSMSIDPADDCTFWYTNEYLPSNGTFNWATQIASFAFPGCSSGSSPVTVSSVNLSSSSVTGGNQLTGNTVTLSAAAPSGGATITFTSNNTSVVPTPSSVTVPQGSTSTTFTVTTNSVSTSTNVIITASYNGSSKNATLTVNPPGSFTISASNFSASQGSQGSATVTVATSNGFTGTVNLSVSGLPPQSSGSLSPPSVTLNSSTTSASSMLKVVTGAHTPTKTYTLTITGTDSSGTITATAAVSLTVQ
jgi:hypothetical protein